MNSASTEQSRRTSPRKIGVGASTAKCSKYELASANEKEGSHLDKTQLLGSDYVSTPHFGDNRTCFEIVTERTGQIQGEICVLCLWDHGGSSFA